MKHNRVLINILGIVILLSSNVALALDFPCNSNEELYRTRAKINWVWIYECWFNNWDRRLSINKDIEFEKEFGFNSNDRNRTNTTFYNCHSLAYNSSRYWINYPNNIFKKFVDNNAITSIENAKRWDRWITLSESPDWKIKIWSRKYNITHSFMFLHDYYWDTTKIKSKYWRMWEYEHELYNIKKVYWENWNAKFLVLKYNGENFSYYRIWNDIKANDENLSEIINNSEFNKEVSNAESINNLELLNNTAKSDKELINDIELSDIIWVFASSTNDLNEQKKLIQNNPKIKELLNRKENKKEIVNLINNKLKLVNYDEREPWEILLNIVKMN